MLVPLESESGQTQVIWSVQFVCTLLHYYAVLVKCKCLVNLHAAMFRVVTEMQASIRFPYQILQFLFLNLLFIK